LAVRPVSRSAFRVNPGLFYTSLGAAIAAQTLTLVVPNHMTVAWWCFREAAEGFTDPAGMGLLAECYYRGQGVTEDPAQAIVWCQKAANMGVAGAKSLLGSILVNGDARAGVEKDAARGFALLQKAEGQGFTPALYIVALCYLGGDGVEKDAARGVSRLRQYIAQGDAAVPVMAETLLASCYVAGNGVEANTVHAAIWCQRAADGGDAQAIQMLPVIRTCDICGTTPARKHCDRCQNVRYCSAACQAQHWNHAVNPHKGHCRRAADGGASTSTGGCVGIAFYLACSLSKFDLVMTS